MRSALGSAVPPHVQFTAASVDIPVHGSFQSLGQLVSEWDELVDQTGVMPYVRPGWVAAWWHAFGTGRLEVRTVRRRDRLAALLPVARRYGALQSATNVHTPQSSLVAEDWHAAMELAHTLFVGRPWYVSVAPLGPDDWAQALRLEAEKAGYKVMLRPMERSPYLSVESDWTTYESHLSKSLRADLRCSQQRLGKLGKVSVDVVDRGERLDEALEEAFAVEASGWKGHGRTAIQSRPDTEHFYRGVARWASERNTLRIFLLRLDERPLAMYYALQERGVCHLLKGGYDPAYRQFSPGKLLMRAVIAHCYAQRLSKVEFHGDAEPYKWRWTDAARQLQRFDAFAPSPAGRLAWATATYGRLAARRFLRGCRPS